MLKGVYRAGRISYTLGLSSIDSFYKAHDITACTLNYIAIPTIIYGQLAKEEETIHV